MKCFHFSIKDNEYFIPLDQVMEMSQFIPITNVPCPPKGVRGVVNLRGKIYPVLDLLMWQYGKSNDSQKILMVCTLKTWNPALIVDVVHGIVDVETQDELSHLGDFKIGKSGETVGVLLDLNNLVIQPASIAS